MTFYDLLLPSFYVRLCPSKQDKFLTLFLSFTLSNARSGFFLFTANYAPLSEIQLILDLLNVGPDTVITEFRIRM